MFDYLIWISRRNERDLINIYNFLSPVVKFANGGNTLNRGYWDEKTRDPAQAQEQLCELIGKFASLDSASTIIDVGSGYSGPAYILKSIYNFLDIVCLDLNFNQLRNTTSSLNEINSDAQDKFNLNSLIYVNATAVLLPFKDHSVDRIIALESHHHFRPLDQFILECKRILKDHGSLVIATPVKTFDSNFLSAALTLGLLSLTFGSKNLLLSHIKKTIQDCGFRITNTLSIGSSVFPGQTEYYIKNRQLIKQRIAKRYPPYIEQLLYKLVIKTKDVYQKRKIDYMLIRCQVG